MSDRVQINCLKQGSIDSTKWSARVLTMDKPTGTLTISRRGQPAHVFYHALKPSTVQRWPHFCADATHDDLNSIEVKRTLCLLGTVAPVPDFAMEELAFVGIPLPFATADLSPEMAEVYPAVEATSSTTISAGEKRRRNTLGRCDAWILRFPSKVSYEVAVQMLREMPDVRFLEADGPRRGAARKTQRFFPLTF